jgi:hypothetical protein
MSEPAIGLLVVSSTGVIHARSDFYRTLCGLHVPKRWERLALDRDVTCARCLEALA